MPRKLPPNPYLYTHQTLWHHTVLDLRPEDIWGDWGSDQVLISAVTVTDDRVNITGQIIKGYGKSKKLHNWSFVHEQTLDVLRPNRSSLDGPTEDEAKAEFDSLQRRGQ